MSWLQKAPRHSQHMDAVHAGHLERPDLTITRRKKRHSQGTNGDALCKCRTHDVRMCNITPPPFACQASNPGMQRDIASEKPDVMA
jgi:hypothetical protein